jgi:hypothetical protein
MSRKAVSGEHLAMAAHLLLVNLPDVGQANYDKGSRAESRGSHLRPLRSCAART